MANFMQVENIVKYACSCGILSPISKLFFCRHCLQLRCGFCVCHEVDSHFCSNCLENIPSSEARSKKNCCANCFDCPWCQHTLSARATTVIVKKHDDSPKDGETASATATTTGAGAGDTTKVLTKKMYYLACLGCRWTSRDVGIPDQAVATGAWPDNECSYQTRFNSLLEYYQAVVLQEKQEKQEYMRRKAPKNHKFPTLTDRTGLTVTMIRRQMGWSDKSTQKAKPVDITQAAPTAEIDELPENIFTQKINLRNVTTIQQRHGQPADQPFTVNKLYPQRRFLWIKRSLRCRQCEHNVIKPEFHPTSIKYRIQLFANYHVPDVLLVRCESPLLAGKLCSVILKLSNPTMHEMKLTLLELPTMEEELKMIEDFKQACIIKDASLSIAAADSLKSLTGVSGGTPSLTTTSLTRQSSVNEEPRIVTQEINAELQKLSSSFILNQRDDSAEYDDEEQAQCENPEFITWRKSNKASIRLQFTPNANLEPGNDVILGFSLQYSYLNTVTNTPEKKDPTKHDLVSRVYVKVGQIAK